MRYALLLVLVILAACGPYSLTPAHPATVTPRPTATATASPTAAATAQKVKARAIVTPTPGVCVVDTPGNEVLNIRVAPGMDKEITGGLLPGTRVTILGESAGWWKIEKGWIYSGYCREEK